MVGDIEHDPVPVVGLPVLGRHEHGLVVEPAVRAVCRAQPVLHVVRLAGAFAAFLGGGQPGHVVVVGDAGPERAVACEEIGRVAEQAADPPADEGDGRGSRIEFEVDDRRRGLDVGLHPAYVGALARAAGRRAVRAYGLRGQVLGRRHHGLEVPPVCIGPAGPHLYPARARVSIGPG